MAEVKFHLLIYSKFPVKKNDLYTKCPCYIKSQELIANQAYYSMMLFKKNALNLPAAEDLRDIACIYGELSSIVEISTVLDNIDIDKLMYLIVGAKSTNESIDELRGDFHKRLKNIDRRKQ